MQFVLRLRFWWSKWPETVKTSSVKIHLRSIQISKKHVVFYSKLGPFEKHRNPWKSNRIFSADLGSALGGIRGSISDRFRRFSKIFEEIQNIKIEKPTLKRHEKCSQFEKTQKHTCTRTWTFCVEKNGLETDLEMSFWHIDGTNLHKKAPRIQPE